MSSSYQIEALPHAVEDLVIANPLEFSLPRERSDRVRIATEQADEFLYLARPEVFAFRACAKQNDGAIQRDSRRRHKRRHARRVVRLCHGDNVMREGAGFKPSSCSRALVARSEACSWTGGGWRRRSRCSQKQFAQTDPRGPISSLLQVKSPALRAFEERALEFSAWLPPQCALIDRGGTYTTKER
jgi:hypothetical protein